MTNIRTFTLHIPHSKQGLYLTMPFEMPENIGKFTLTYEYPKRGSRKQTIPGGSFAERQKNNTVDLGLVTPGNRQVAATGSDKQSITLSETWATPGCTPCKLIPGTWQILAGAYRIAPEGVDVQYSLTFEEKTPRWLSGDLHTHTLASDGSKTALELCQHARSQGLDFLAITDHNQFVTRASLPQLPDFTVIPGVEWTHYRGHSNFLGLEQPYDEPFFANEEAEVAKRFQTAHGRGALIVLNHTHDDDLPFSFDSETLPYDCLEIWNGPMRPPNLRAVAAWHARLEQGQKVPMVCGSDYHKD
ncbi:MAG TPA: CehA/McbA family metallohydrolase, partial [Anaerolineaceae bacterium]|nr:CehA/McbA family metallohydrolase [Anaerolineaceae bacterium]